MRIKYYFDHPDSIDWLDFAHPSVALGDSTMWCRAQHDVFPGKTISENERALIPGAVLRSQLTGKPAFVDESEQKLKRRIEPRSQGRPQKEPQQVCAPVTRE